MRGQNEQRHDKADEQTHTSTASRPFMPACPACEAESSCSSSASGARDSVTLRTIAVYTGPCDALDAIVRRTRAARCAPSATLDKIVTARQAPLRHTSRQSSGRRPDTHINQRSLPAPSSKPKLGPKDWRSLRLVKNWRIAGPWIEVLETGLAEVDASQHTGGRDADDSKMQGERTSRRRHFAIGSAACPSDANPTA